MISRSGTLRLNAPEGLHQEIERLDAQEAGFSICLRFGVSGLAFWVKGSPGSARKDLKPPMRELGTHKVLRIQPFRQPSQNSKPHKTPSNPLETLLDTKRHYKNPYYNTLWLGELRAPAWIVVEAWRRAERTQSAKLAVPLRRKIPQYPQGTLKAYTLHPKPRNPNPLCQRGSSSLRLALLRFCTMSCDQRLGN